MRLKVMKVLFLVLGIAAVGFGIMYFTYLAPMNKTLSEVRTMEINDVKLDALKDWHIRANSATAKLPVLWRQL